jgi:hypothetical protein
VCHYYQYNKKTDLLSWSHHLPVLQPSIEEKIEINATNIYGADGIVLEPLAKEQVKRYKRQVRENSDCKNQMVSSKLLNWIWPFDIGKAWQQTENIRIGG